MQPIDTAPDGPPGFIALEVDDNEIVGVEWLQGPVGSDGKRWCLNSHNRNSFPATHWIPLPDTTKRSD